MKVNLSSRAGVASLKTEMQTMKLSSFTHVIPDANDCMEHLYKQIIQNGGTHDDVELDLFTMWKTSKNNKFRLFIKKLQDEFNDGAPYTHKDIITKTI